jgi:hypothetical protein
MLERDYHPDFSLDWALKDLDLASSASGPGVLPVASAIADRWLEWTRRERGPQRPRARNIGSTERSFARMDCRRTGGAGHSPTHLDVVMSFDVQSSSRVAADKVRFRANLQGEIDSAVVYRAMARAEKSEQVSSVCAAG